uniref:Amino acid/polyamine/organocation transporter, APC superfamily n=1 Tax=Candidatus Kentrum sp. LPFa TaxID=2126335 RepID=A0A450XF06_9GAMM|nr:MAG: amino acid/polyamine/organocation transporter, APC superfamily [Candidatus Kentron sp. LPFa]
MNANPSNNVASGALLAEVIPPRLLPRVLKRFDMVAIYFALIFGSYGAAQMAGQGWAGIPMMALAAVTFLLPCTLASYELGTLFPGEGGIYIWAHKTLGPIHGFIAGWLGWVPIFLLLPLGATTIIAHVQFVFGTEWPLWAQVAGQIAIVLLIGGISAARLLVSQRYVRWMFWISMGTAVSVFIAGFISEGTGTPVDSSILSFDISEHGALYSAAILWLLGVEVPFNMGAEFKDHRRTAGTMYLWGSIALLAGYFMGIAGILWLIGGQEIDATTGVARAASAAYPALGLLVGIGICFAVVSQDVAYMNSYSRLLFISGIEKRLPEVFSQVTETTRVPVPALLIQILGAIMVLLVFSTQAQLAVAFNLYLAALVAVWCASLFYLYIGIVRARGKYSATYRERGADVWKIPGGTVGVWIVAIWGTIFNAIAIWYVFALPWTSDIDPSGWRLWLFGVSGVVVLFGIVIYLNSKRRADAFNLEEELRKYARFDLPSGQSGV